MKKRKIRKGYRILVQIQKSFLGIKYWKTINTLYLI
ncbi:hypothetical protein [Riemerella phage vB_RanS_GDF21]|nr:hypothetical protein [Phage vB_RanS_PJN03]